MDNDLDRNFDRDDTDLGTKGDENRTSGKMDQLGGKIKESAGDLTGNEDWQAEGQADQMKGKAKEGMGRVENAADDLTS